MVTSSKVKMACLNDMKSDCCNLFHNAAKVGDLETLKNLITKVDVNCKEEITRETALHVANRSLINTQTSDGFG